MNAIKLFYAYIFTIAALIICAELLLEYRHYNLGYTTPILGTKAPQEKEYSSPQLSPKFGPTEAFPFKSRIILPKKTTQLRLWIASSSHAVGGRTPAKDIFPNLICKAISTTGNCETINGSGPGMLINENIQLLRKYAKTYQPDYAILYQMSLEISNQQKLLTSSRVPPPKNHAIINTDYLTKWLQQTSLYTHLSDYIGGNIKLSGLLKEELPPSMATDFENRIISFINTCRELNITPILTNFSVSHDLSNLANMHYSERTNFVKYNSYLSPTGWVKTLDQYNSLLLDIAKKHEIELIDSRTVMNGKPEYFSDFIHFNKRGHAALAQIISSHINATLETEHTQDDI
ncbi:hypothetical protein NO559_15135 [Dasania sp. GY-MA-18]|uniref:SGNH hydrolase-type esterase domain-containing protein n=1 Tax=Dasania phycosphaerae TaxID=2950436 RepID=A0A9J6RQQ0_9GAMM|nr:MULTISPECIES: hypothetical protein [Dasania]MCR8924117.1 hypothetical protein [Dasania sp. GY-MA-18]MCZ0866690.1 hypothetical protein [Dasania phycosphaerae]MCZ0870275.1 hypothetical protein [Dasania phycosphaerae]